MRKFIVALTAVSLIGGFSFAGSAFAADGYKLDAKGKCHDASGKFAKAEMCKTGAATTDKKEKCRDDKGKFISCNAKPATPATAATPATKTTAAKPATPATPAKKATNAPTKK